SALLAAFVTLAVAIAILLRDRRRVYVRFALLALNLCAWHASSFFYRAFGETPWNQLRFATGVLVPAATLSLFASLANLRFGLITPLRRTVTISGVVIAALALTPYFSKPWADALAATYGAVALFVTFQLVWQRSRQQTE